LSLIKSVLHRLTASDYPPLYLQSFLAVEESKRSSDGKISKNQIEFERCIIAWNQICCSLCHYLC